MQKVRDLRHFTTCRNCNRNIIRPLNFCSYECLLEFKNRKDVLSDSSKLRKIKVFGINKNDDAFLAQVYQDEIRRAYNQLDREKINVDLSKRLSFFGWLTFQGIEIKC